MSGPNDSGAGDTPTGDFKLPTLDATTPTLSPKYRLRLHWDTPRLQWAPVLALRPPARDQPEFLRLDDPFAAVLEAERYMRDGALLFDMRRLSFDVIDKAFLEAPTAPPNLLAQLRADEGLGGGRLLPAAGSHGALVRRAGAYAIADAAADRAAAAVAVLQAARSRRPSRRARRAEGGLGRRHPQGADGPADRAGEPQQAERRGAAPGAVAQDRMGHRALARPHHR